MIVVENKVDIVVFLFGVNMFLAARQPAKRYHVAALVRWEVPFLVTAGHKIDASASISSNQSAFEEEEIPLEEFDDAEETLEEI